MRNELTKQAESLLVGKVIKSVRFMTRKEIEVMGWYSGGIIITLHDGTQFYPSADEEGNDSGVIFFNHRNQFGMIPKLNESEL